MNSKYKTNIEIEVTELYNLKEDFKKLSDPRIKRKSTYKAQDIVTVAFLAVLSNCNDWEKIHEFAIKKYDWLKSLEYRK